MHHQSGRLPWKHLRVGWHPWLRPGSSSTFPTSSSGELASAGRGRRPFSIRRVPWRLAFADGSGDPPSGWALGGDEFLASRLLVARVSPCSAGSQVLVADRRQPRQHVFHLLLGLGIVDLEVALIVENAADPRADALVAVVEPASHLALNHGTVIEIVAILGRQPIGLRQRAHRVLDRRDRLLLHREDAGDFFPQLAARVFRLAGRIFLGDDPQADLAALADVRPLERVEIAGVGIERDDASPPAA